MKSFFFMMLGLTCGFTSFMTLAGPVYLSPGGSQVIKANDNIDTVFISSPSIADYELIGEKSVVVYANNEGQADLVAFDKDGEQILKMTLIVDAVLNDVYSQVNQEFSDSKVTIQKMGKTYIISGTAPTEESRDRIYQIVGEGVGADAVVNKKKVKGVEDAGGGDDSQTWLDETVYRGVINKLELPVTNQVNVKLSVVEVSR